MTEEIKPRAYLDKYKVGVLVITSKQVEDKVGYFVGHWNPTSRKMSTADLSDGGKPKSKYNPKTLYWEEVQERLDRYAEAHDLKEYKWNPVQQKIITGTIKLMEVEE